MENNKKIFLYGLVCVIGFTTILADVPTPTDPKDAELEMLLQKSEQLLQEVTLVAKKVDAATTEQVVTMQESIEMLQEVNENLTIEMYEIKSNIEFINSTATPFELGPIVSDTTSRR